MLSYPENSRQEVDDREKQVPAQIHQSFFFPPALLQQHRQSPEFLTHGGRKQEKGRTRLFTVSLLAYIPKFP
jgi:hypothetical protein